MEVQRVYKSEESRTDEIVQVLYELLVALTPPDPPKTHTELYVANSEKEDLLSHES
jgi:hypothetical protein